MYYKNNSNYVDENTSLRNWCSNSVCDDSDEC